MLRRSNGDIHRLGAPVKENRCNLKIVLQTAPIVKFNGLTANCAAAGAETEAWGGIND